MEGRRFDGLIVDFAGVLTSNMVEVIGVDSTNLMGRLLSGLSPAYDVLRVVRQARAAGIRTAVLSNSLGRQPHDPYDRYFLPGSFDAVVLSDQYGLRKPDPVIFRLTLDQLGVAAKACVFADDTEENLLPAYQMGMTVVHALDEDVTAPCLRHLLGLPDHRAELIL